MANHADADCVMTGLTLLGLLPQGLLKRVNRDVGLLDTDPVGNDFRSLEFGALIRLWGEAMHSVKQSGWSWLFGLHLWLDLLEHRELYDEKLAELEKHEDERIRLALEDYAQAKVSPSGRVILLLPSRVKGFDVQFVRQKDNGVNTLAGWRHWCLAAYVRASGKVLLSCPNQQVAEAAFGQAG